MLAVGHVLARVFGRRLPRQRSGGMDLVSVPPPSIDLLVPGLRLGEVPITSMADPERLAGHPDRYAAILHGTLGHLAAAALNLPRILHKRVSMKNPG